MQKRCRQYSRPHGYTAWDCTSPAFVKDGTLCIPTAFCSYTGEALDKKTPLLRSMEAINNQALRILRLFGNSAAKVTTTVGAEQEYFLIDRELYNKRMDLILTGRTLFGAKPPKGQELEDHYFGNIKERISDYMKELDLELWKLGISAKTKHNEVAPAQHELALVFTTANIATDHNQLTMEFMKKIAQRQGLVCLLHEKPFAGINGSGKHNNWSMATNDGQNLLEPGSTPHENKQFLLFLSAILRAVDLHADLLRISIASAGNDHRLGANEAPPAIVSVFLGNQLTEILSQLEKGRVEGKEIANMLDTGVAILPSLPKDSTDRNRTSPFAFTGNKFEFRMVGSAQSIAGPNYILNTIVADVLKEFADRLEKAKDFDKEVIAIVSEVAKNHKRIIFNGNNYSQEWVLEAEKRGLANIKSTVESIPLLINEKNIELFERHGVLSRMEVESRYEMQLENYIKTINIEALAMISIAKTDILPAAFRYIKEISDSVNSANATGAKVDISAQIASVEELSSVTATFKKGIDGLEKALEKTVAEKDTLKQAQSFRKLVVSAMESLRESGDTLETLVSKDLWPLPTFTDLLFKV